MIIKIILAALAVGAFALWFIKKANKVRDRKALVRQAHMRWLLEKADECELKEEKDDATKTWPGPGAMA